LRLIRTKVKRRAGPPRRLRALSLGLSERAEQAAGIAYKDG
jgi:hypothetical protein